MDAGCRCSITRLLTEAHQSKVRQARSAAMWIAATGLQRLRAGSGQAAHADRVLLGEVDKVSTLIGSLYIGPAVEREIEIDRAAGQHVFSPALGFRGDTVEAWQHAARCFVRELQATAAKQR